MFGPVLFKNHQIYPSQSSSIFNDYDFKEINYQVDCYDQKYLRRDARDLFCNDTDNALSDTDNSIYDAIDGDFNILKINDDELDDLFKHESTEKKPISECFPTKSVFQNLISDYDCDDRHEPPVAVISQPITFDKYSKAYLIELKKFKDCNYYNGINISQIPKSNKYEAIHREYIEKMKKNRKPIAAPGKKIRISSKYTKVVPLEIIENLPETFEQEQKSPNQELNTANLNKNLIEEEKLKDLLHLHEKSLKDFMESVSNYERKRSDKNKSKNEKMVKKNEDEPERCFFCFNLFSKKEKKHLNVSIAEEAIELNEFEVAMKRHEENYKIFQNNFELVQNHSQSKEFKNDQKQKKSECSLDSEISLKNFKTLLERHDAVMNIQKINFANENVNNDKIFF